MIAAQSIPVYTTLADVFGGLEPSLEHAIRWDHVIQEFERRFGKKPSYIARAPGRVNLIGEHIDYALFGVLPAAVERDILIACAPRDPPSAEEPSEVRHRPGSVVAENIHPKYQRQTFAPELDISSEDVQIWQLDIDTRELRWESYVKAGYYGVLNDHLSQTNKRPVPVDLLVSGSVPAGSGLSSSAAMVVASTLAFLAVNEQLEDVDGHGKAISKGKLVELAMENEKRVGVNSGGMDQAASVMSDPSSALYITFYPSLAASNVPLPQGVVFVCANSLIVADKAVGAKRGYNLRVVETLVGARILANSLGLKISPTERITFREVVGKFAGEKVGEDMGTDALEKALETLGSKLDVLNPREIKGGQSGVTMSQMIEMSGLSKEAFDEVYLSWVQVEATHFQLYKRARHVLSEARRVLQFRQACLAAATGNSFISNEIDNTTFETLGRLMNDSQDSCAKSFECSCPELDDLTRLAREAGAFGSRLTGAGWGGCTVSLVAESNVNAFIAQVQRTYEPYRGLSADELSQVIFATKPGPGACVFKVES